MNAVTTPSTTEDVQELERIRGHHERAARINAENGATGPLRAFALMHAPQLLDIATRGVQARQQLDPLAGLSIRAAALRDLHAAEYVGGGLIVCIHCTLLGPRGVLYPCRTLQLLDGLQAP